ncbi:MAG: hypothetical protein K9M36_02010 [Candidatus Pacebacteria bacterium]|nr:hypothetical protein [Candidatus Paceibacterota bacterium]
MSFLHTYTSHAYFLSGDPQTQTDYLVNLLQNNTDFNHHIWKQYDSLISIENVHEAKKMAQSKQSETEKTWIILGGISISREAQHTLLKLLEEPASGTHIVICLPSYDQLLETVQSRLTLFPASDSVSTYYDEEVTLFIQKPYKERIPYIKQISDDLKEGNIARFLEALQKQIYQLHIASKDPGKYALLLEEILHMQRYARNQGAMITFILEHLALMIPE